MPSTRIMDAGLATYATIITVTNPAAAATDWVVFTCPAGCKAKFRKLQVSGSAVAGRQQSVQLVRRTSPNTGGTSASVPIGKMDPSDGPGQVSAVVYSVNPTGLGASAGVVGGGSIGLVTAGGVQDAETVSESGQSMKPPTFGQSVTDYLCVNLGGIATIATDKLDLVAVWTEGG